MDDDRGPFGAGSASDPHAHDVWVAGVRLGAQTLAEVEGLRASAAAVATAQADQLRRVAALAARCERDARAALALTPGAPGSPSENDLVRTVVTHELMVVLGISKPAAERLHDLSDRLVRVLPETLAALECGRLDLARTRVLVEETRLLDTVSARAVQTAVLATPDGAPPPAGPWEGPSPRAWRAKIQRTVVRVDADAARRRREAALRDRLIRAWAAGDGVAVMQVVGGHLDIALADRVFTDLALARPAVDAEGTPLSIDQRRVDAFNDLIRRVAHGEELPAVSHPSEQEVGLVLHADTLFADGPARDEPGELRGLGAPTPVDARSAAALAGEQLAAGAATRVLLTDAAGALVRTLRLRSPADGWTRQVLLEAARAALPHLPSLETESYEPTVAITDHVRARNPHCAGYDCPRVARRCDLDRVEEWPRGPTAAPTSVRAVDATTSSRPEASCALACTATGP